MDKYGILAYPAGHSLSPVMHNAAFKELGIDAEYGVFEVAPEDLSAFVRARDFAGLSVSLPHKIDVMQCLDEVSEDAKKIGAVNTVANRDEKLQGFNTDFIGANKALEEVCGLAGKTVVVWGAGGAARAVVYGALKAGAEVFIVNRSVEKAQALAEEMGELFDRKIEVQGLHDPYQGDILVQASSIWLHEDVKIEEMVFGREDFLKSFELVMDIVYKPMMTPLLVRAQELGVPFVTGEKMLLYQAVEQFEIWTGRSAPVQVMHEALMNAL